MIFLATMDYGWLLRRKIHWIDTKNDAFKYCGPFGVSFCQQLYLQQWLWLASIQPATSWDIELLITIRTNQLRFHPCFWGGVFLTPKKKWGFCATSPPNRVFFGWTPSKWLVFHDGHKWGVILTTLHSLKKNILQVTFPPIFKTPPFPRIMGESKGNPNNHCPLD